MRSFISITFLALSLVGCATVPNGFHQVWMESTPPRANLAAPAGFKITPLEAYKNLAKWDVSYADTSKHIWHIYADSRCYYFLDILSEPESSKISAYIHGVQIEGQQGLIILKDAHHYY